MIHENRETRWYVVHTYSGYENKVKTNLEKIIENRGISDMIMDVKIPTETVVETTATGETKTREHKLFPAYVFVKMIMTDETWHVVRNITGATGFVGPGSRPVPLTDEEVEALGVETVRPKELSFKIGDNVKIAANAVVLEAIPSDCTAVGIPARVVRRRGAKVDNFDQVHTPDPVTQEMCRMNVRIEALRRTVDELEDQLEALKDEAGHPAPMLVRGGEYWDYEI